MDLVMELLKSVLYGILQGITEWLPISSTGHLILLNSVLPLNIYQDPVKDLEFWNMYKVVIQLGSILAVAVLFVKRLWPFSEHRTPAGKKSVFRLWAKIALGTLPAAVAGLLLDEFVDRKLSGTLVVGIVLIVYGILFLIVERKPRIPRINEVKGIRGITALLTGCFEALAIIPGTSRSGVTIIGGTLLGMSRPVATEFSFYLAVPLMTGASLLKLAELPVSLNFHGIAVLLAGMISAFGVSLVVLRSLLNYVRNNDFRLFGYYRIVLGLMILILSLIGALPEGMIA
ncbi:MAG: undecaprenyl-diphosphate phosphatase [Solobacterium sp.]|nr:undecaprenyl-diphosphate phosphatase [Solobacterium sp.]